jgi:type VI secretion system protein ImpM
MPGFTGLKAMAHLGILGKHPDFPDFIQAGFSEPVRAGISEWLDQRLPVIRDACGDEWHEFWYEAQSLRFWVGQDIFGSGVVGILLPSGDRVGRRFPLILGVEGACVEPPHIQTDQSLWEKLETHLARIKGGQGAKSLLTGLDLTFEDQKDHTGANWAYRPDGNLDELFLSVIQADTCDAVKSRSYWWAPRSTGRAAVWLGCEALPDADTLGMLLNGVSVEGTVVDGKG